MNKNDYEALARIQRKKEERELRQQEQEISRAERGERIAQRRSGLQHRQYEARHPIRTSARRTSGAVMDRLGRIAVTATKQTRESYDKTQRTMKPRKTSRIRQVISGFSGVSHSGREVVPNRGGGLGQRIVQEMSANYVEHLDRDYFGNQGQPARDLLGNSNQPQRDLLGSSHNQSMDLLGNQNQKKKLELL